MIAVNWNRSISNQIDRLRFLRGVAIDPLSTLERVASGDLPNRVRLGKRTILFPSSAEAVKDVLLDNSENYSWRDGVRSIMTITGPSAFGVCDGELHKRYRNPIEESFSRKRYTKWDTNISEVCEDLVRDLRQESKTDITISIQKYVRQAVLTSLFRSDISNLDDIIESSFAPGFRYMNSQLTLYQFMTPFSRFRKVIAARKNGDDAIEAAISARRAGCPHSTTGLNSDIVDDYIHSSDSTYFSDKIIRQQVSEIVAAGQETTSATFGWLVFELGRNRDARSRVEAEVRSLDRLPTSYRSSKSLRYTRAAISEILRLHPPVPVAPRTVERPQDVAGEFLFPGDLVVLSQHVRHRDPSVWPNAEIFSPERWLTQRNVADRFSYFPFGLGTRRCIGHELAKRILIQFVFSVYRNFDIELASAPDEKMKGIVTIIPAGGVPISAKPINKIGE